MVVSDFIIGDDKIRVKCKFDFEVCTLFGEFQFKGGVEYQARMYNIKDFSVSEVYLSVCDENDRFCIFSTIDSDSRHNLSKYFYTRRELSLKRLLNE